MRRIYFLLPDVDVARKIVDELLLSRIAEKDIHVIAKEGTEMADLPEASLAQKSDVIPAFERGIAVGGATGLLAGVAAVTFPPAGLVLGGGALLGIALAGTGFGALMSTMIGVSAPNSRHEAGQTCGRHRLHHASGWNRRRALESHNGSADRRTLRPHRPGREAPVQARTPATL